MSVVPDISGLNPTYGLSDIMVWLMALGVVAIYSFVFAFTRSNRLGWSLTAIGALGIMALLILMRSD